MTEIKVYFDREGFSFIDGVLVEVKIDSYHYTVDEQGKVDAEMQVWDGHYRMAVDVGNFFESAEAYKEGREKAYHQLQLHNVVPGWKQGEGFEAFAIEKGEVKKIFFEPKDVIFLASEEEVIIKDLPKQIYGEELEAQQHLPLDVQYMDGHAEHRKSVAELVALTDVQKQKLEAIQQAVMDAKDAGIALFIDFDCSTIRAINKEQVDYFVDQDNADNEDYSPIHRSCESKINICAETWYDAYFFYKLKE